MTGDPKPRKRSYRIVHSPPRGSQRALKHGARSRAGMPVGDLRQAREVARKWLMEAVDILDEDGNLPERYLPAIEVMALPVSRLQHMAEWLEGNPGAAGNFRLVREMRRLESHVWRMLESFGLTPRSREALKLDVAATGALQRIQPVRTPERAREIARLIAQNGMAATPTPPDDDVVEGHEVQEDTPSTVRRINE